MNNIDQKECISVKFSEGLGIFDNYYRYPEIDKREKYNGMPTGKVVDKQGIQAHAGRDYFVPEGEEFCFEIDECPYLNIAIKAEKDTKTCLLLMVNDKKPYQHKNRFVVIGRTLKGDPGIYDVIKRKDLLIIKDDGKWHDDYCFDLRKIRNKFRNAGSISGIEFYSLTGSGEHSFHFIDLICKSGTARSPIKSIAVSPTLVKANEKITVTATAEPGGRARFSIAQVPGAADVAMEENPDEPGTYSGYYVTEKGDDVENADVTVVFTSRSGETVSRKAEQTVTIDTIPPKILDAKVTPEVVSNGQIIQIRVDASESKCQVKADISGLDITQLNVELIEEPAGSGKYQKDCRISRENKASNGIKNILLTSTDAAGNVGEQYGIRIELKNPRTETFIVRGQIFFEYGLPAADATVRVYTHGFGGAEMLLCEGKTDNQGFYRVSYNTEGQPTNLELRILDTKDKEISLCDTKFKFEEQEIEKHEVVLNLIAPASIRPLTNEYMQLKSDIEKQIGNIDKLADARENAQRSDLTILHQTTGWDTRIIALATNAARLSKETGISHEAFYALSRAGLPTEKQILATVSSSIVEKAFSRAKDAGIVSPDFSVERAAKDFESFSRQTLRSMKAQGTPSSYGEFFDKSGLCEADKGLFEEIYFTHRGEPAELWKKAREKGIETERLKLQGKLAYLTLNNADLTNILQQDIGSMENLKMLVDKDLYQTDAWKKLLMDMAGNDEEKLRIIIPPAYKGEKTADRLDAYAADLARKVRLSFPARVVRRMIEKDELPLCAGEHKDDVLNFFDKTEELGFKLGRMSVEAFVQKYKNDIFPENTPPEKINAVKQNFKKLQRLYQITPNNGALKVLLEQGFSSAHDIDMISEDVFLDRFGSFFSSNEEAKLVHRKSSQVSAITFSILTTAQLMKSAPALTVISSPPIQENLNNLSNFNPAMEIGKYPEKQTENFINELIKHYPTMESLFGSLDFCECEHCRSVLSPAAYFVDLLQFLDPDNLEWQKFLDDEKIKNKAPYPFKNAAEADRFLNGWKAEHNTAPYPFKNPEEWNKFLNYWRNKYPNKADPDPEIRIKPYDLLIGRRPDLANLPLTCENTNTALPYIDLVNEILEHYVAYNNLNDYKGYDTGNATTPELLAEPQNIIIGAYDELKKAHYPLTLPFDLWLETVRRFFDHFETPLWQILKVFRLRKDLFVPPGTSIENPTNIKNNDATIEVPDADAARFKAEDIVTYYEIPSNILHTEKKSISSIGAAGSAGAGKTLLTLKGEWITPPDAGDLLVNADRCYNWANIFTEYLGISPSEYNLFTDSDVHSRWYELYGYTNKDQALTKAFNDQRQRIDLNSAKALSRRLGISYNELVELLLTGFINPDLDSLIVLRKMGLDTKDVFRYKKHPNYQQFTAEEESEFGNRLDDLTKKFNPKLDPHPFNARNWLDESWQNSDFNRILVLADPNTGCNFDETIIQYADGTAADKLVFLKINLFVRIWKKLGWTVEETDRTLQVFLPKNSLPLTIQNLGTALKTSLVYISHLKAIDERLKIGKNSRIKLLPLWSNLSTTGKNPLYAQLFLTSSVLNIDPVFDSPLGNSLSKASVLIKDHLLAVQAALNLTADEIKNIIEGANRKLNTEPLTLEIVSLLYRYGLLAKALKLPVIDLITLKKLSALDPFEPLKSDPLAVLNDDYPYTKTLHFIEIVDKVKESNFTVEDLDFLLRHHFDPVGKYRSVSDMILAPGLMKTLAAEILRIKSDNYVITEDILRQKLTIKLPPGADAVDFIKLVRELACNKPIPDDELRNKINDKLIVPCTNDLLYVVKTLISDLCSEYSTFTDDMLRQKLSLVLPVDILEKFFGFWKDTVEFSAKKEQVEKEKRLDPVTYQVNSIRVSYDATRKWQHVVHVGVLTDKKKDDILNKIPDAATPDKLEAYNYFKDELLKDIKEKSEAQPKEFIDKYFEGFLKYDDLFGPNITGLSEEAKRHRIMEEILPFVQFRLIRQLIVQTLATNLNADPALTEMALTARAVPLKKPGDPLIEYPSKSGKLLLDAFESSGERGVSAKFFDINGSQLGQTRTIETADTSIKLDNTPIKPAGAKSAHFEGYMEVPATGAYRFFAVFTTKDSTAQLRFEHLPDPVIRHKAAKNNDETDKFVELKAGTPYRFTFEIDDLGGGDVSLMVMGEKEPKSSLSRLTLYPQTVVEHVHRTLMLLKKTIQLINGLGKSEREVRHILTHRADFEDFDFARLPTLENDTIAEKTDKLFKQFLLLADYAHLKRGLSAGTDDLISIFENACRTYPEITEEKKAIDIHFEPIARLTRRDSTTVRRVAEKLDFEIKAAQDGKGYRVEVRDIASVEKIWRLWEALQVVEKLGIPVEKLVDMAIPTPDYSTSSDLRNTINARYEKENWQRIAQSIFDKLRQRKRDALTAYIMHKEGFERIEQLYEYFLIDPGMEPVVQTSRIRLAISSVQLFIQRSLLNLEKKVNPTAINSKHWQWMKRYRVWEANRNIFLFPENWLEPEFRDDKTHLFQELEGALLQGDVSNDLVEDAFFKYLKKLEELASLDIVTMYCEEKSNILHVIGRTFSLPHKYFYRRYSNHIWTPWEPITAEIEGDHVAAVIFRERLHIFWLTFFEKAKEDTSGQPKFIKIDNIQIDTFVNKEVEVQLNWSEYFQGQWTTRESGGFGNPVRADVGRGLKPYQVFIFITRNEDGSILINLDSLNKAFRVVSKNNPPEPVTSVGHQNPPYNVMHDQPTRYKGSNTLQVTYVEEVETLDEKTSKIDNKPKDIITEIPEDISLLLLNRPSTLMDDIRDLSHTVTATLSSSPDSPHVQDFEELVLFADSLPFLLNDLSESATTAITKEWKVIQKRIQVILLARKFFPKFWQLFSKVDQLSSNLDKLISRLSNQDEIDKIKEYVNTDINRLESPFFYQDKDNTFYVEPTKTETTTTDYEGYVMSDLPEEEPWDIKAIDNLNLEVNIPLKKPPLTDPIDPLAKFRIQSRKEWVSDYATVLRFDNVYIGQEGKIDLKVLPATAKVSDFGTPLKVNAGSEVPTGSVVVAVDKPGLGGSIISLKDTRLNLIGSSGLNSALSRSLINRYGGV